MSLQYQPYLLRLFFFLVRDFLAAFSKEDFLTCSMKIVDEVLAVTHSEREPSMCV